MRGDQRFIGQQGAIITNLLYERSHHESLYVQREAICPCEQEKHLCHEEKHLCHEEKHLYHEENLCHEEKHLCHEEKHLCHEEAENVLSFLHPIIRNSKRKNLVFHALDGDFRVLPIVTLKHL
jgi:hypothetical protein